MNLIVHAQDKGIAKIHLTTNATLLDDERIAFLTCYPVHLQIQVFSNRPEPHDCLTGRPGSHNVFIQNLRKLKQAGVPYSFSLLLTEETLAGRSEAMEYFQAFKPHQLVVDVLYPADPRGSGLLPGLSLLLTILGIVGVWKLGCRRLERWQIGEE